MIHRIKIIILVVLIILLNIGCDQSTKYLAKKNLQHRGTVNIIHTFVILKYAENNGGFLSFGSDFPQPYKTIILTIFPVIMITVFLIYLIFKKNLSLLQIICISCILGGGISNVVDRIIYNGFVTDFLNFGIGNIRTGILNCADLSITFGIVFLLLFHYVEQKKVKPVKGDQ